MNIVKSLVELTLLLGLSYYKFHICHLPGDDMRQVMMRNEATMIAKALPKIRTSPIRSDRH